MADVFLSYAREDIDAARRLATNLAAHGLSVFWDRELPVGSRWDRVLEHELATAACVVVLWSRASADSDWVRLEASDAADRGRLIPVMLEAVTVPLRFRLLQNTDLAEWRRGADDAALAPLLAAVRARVGAGGVTAAEASSTGPVPTRLRAEPATLSGKALTAFLVGNGFFDRQRNAAGCGITHDYRPIVAGEDLALHDAATGLTWQHGASPRVMTADSTDVFLGRLNSGSFAGFDDWRLPTIEEAATLLDPEAHEGFHISPAFARGANFIWTADSQPDGRLWLVYFHDGTFASETRHFNAWVRAVRAPR